MIQACDFWLKLVHGALRRGGVGGRGGGRSVD